MRARRIVLAVLLLPPLLAWAVLAAVTLTHQPRRVQTGDALVDTYVQMVLDHEYPTSLNVLDCGNDFEVNTAISAAKWAELEQRFGGDRRFWWLCFKRRVWLPEGLLDGRLDYLREAQRRGLADFPMLLVLYFGQEPQGDDSTDSRLFCVSNQADPQALPKFMHARRRRLDRRYHDPADRHLARLRASAPQHPLPYYLEAMLAGERGQLDQAYKLLRRGNALAKQAPRHDSTYHAVLAPGNGVDLPAAEAPLRVVADDLSSAHVELLSQTFVWDAVLLADEAVQLKRWDLVNEIHRMSCYQAIFQGYADDYAVLEQTVFTTIQSAVREQMAMHRDLQRESALVRLEGEREALSTQFWAHGAQLQPLTLWQQLDMQYISSVRWYAVQILTTASNNSYLTGGMLLNTQDPAYWLGEPTPDWEEDLDRRLNHIASWDYATCTFTDAGK